LIRSLGLRAVSPSIFINSAFQRRRSAASVESHHPRILAPLLRDDAHPVCVGAAAMKEGTMDEDLERMSRDALVAEVKRLREGIRAHRDTTGHELCWHHPALWALLPERTDPLPTVPAWPQFMRGCIRYRQSLDEQLPDAPRSSAEFRDGAGAGA
jgi:hypothetical protein